MDMFFTQEKIQKRVQELEPYRYQNKRPIPNWRMYFDNTKQVNYPPKAVAWQAVEPGYEWRGLDQYIWLTADFEVPDQDNTILLFDLGLPSNLHQTGFEGLLFINDVPYQGIDANHKEVILDKKWQHQKITLAIKLWTGLYGRHGDPNQEIINKFQMAASAHLDRSVDNLYFTARNMVDTVAILAKDSSDRVEMLNTLDRGFQLIDWQVPGSEDFYLSCKKADALLTDYLTHTVKGTKASVTAIGHTHIDLAWLWRLKHTHEKAARSFSTVLRLMEQYLDYVFLQSTPQIYQFIKADYPEIYAQIKARIQEGRWEVDGGMWLEADCNMPSGESLVRQILYGTEFMAKEFHKKPHYLWLPDVFGYSWALPQILKKSGLTTFMTTKISWNEYNRMPHDTFMWRGIDGTEILTHFITTPDPGKMAENPDSWFYTYNGLMTPSSVKGIYDAYSDKIFNENLLLAYGYGDGGGGVSRDMLESRRKLDQIPGLPHVKTATANAFFDKLHDTVAKTDRYVPTWDGELYLEFHRGTYTSQAYMKKMNRKLELKLRELEFQTIFNGNFPKALLHQAWTIVLRNQFHDIIPGSAIHEVYEDAHHEYDQALEIIQKIQATLTSKTAASEAETTYTLWNSAGWARSETVFISEQRVGHFTDVKGQALTSVKKATGYQVFVPEIPGLGTKKIKFTPVKLVNATQEAPVATISENTVTTNNYKITWNDQGQLTEIYDRQNQRQVLTEHGLGNVFEIFEDKPRDYDAWNIDAYYIQKKQILNATQIKVVENTALQAVINFEFTYLNSKIQQSMILYRDSRRIDFKTKVLWQERQKLLKTAFEANIRATEARYQIQFGNLTRTTTWNTSWDWAKFETVGHQWADLSEHNYGVALLNDSKYGYAIKDQQLTLTLLKGAVSPDPTADIGTHEFTYSLLPHAGDFVTGAVEQNAWALNQPITVSKNELAEKEAVLFEMPKTQVLAVDAIKQGENDETMILRLHDHTGGQRKVTLTPKFKFKEWAEVNLMEEDTEETVWQDTPVVTLTLAPYEVKTIQFRFK
ncbi:alpha-mannosidase [Agrilactobacillus yilanensis]|uniref:Alpha-mannosidase n=1 Tax=Agrilactobacillus yilanensis TaxID=2485997 RepID=A0ABW4J7Y3_9LACO|nr:alpha-mannosidase [Agrilactobacillus yilanensis]